MTDQEVELHPGDLVEHATFGLGKVLDVQLTNVLVHFRDDNQDVRKLSIEKAPLTLPADQSDPLLDCLLPFNEGKFESRVKRVGLGDAIAAFCETYPKGFEDPAYVGADAGERADKWAAHELYESTLGNGLGEALLEAGEMAELAHLVEKIVVPTKMLGKFEAIALRDGLKDEAAAQPFFEALFALVAAPPDATRFAALAAALEKLPSKTGKSRVTTWPVLTILPSLARPDRFVFLKPDPSVAGAQRLRFDLEYDAELRWVTYRNLLALADSLLEKLRPLGARDYLDVLSFLWIIEKV